MTATKEPRPLTELRLPEQYRVRILNAFYFASIHSIGQLCEMRPVDLLGLRNFGLGSLAAVRTALANEGLRLWNDVPHTDRSTCRWKGWAVIENGHLETFVNVRAAKARFQLRKAGGWPCQLVHVEAKFNVFEESKTS